MVQRATAAAERSYYKAHAELMSYRAANAPADSTKQTSQISSKPNLQNKPNSPVPPNPAPAATPTPLRASYPANLALRL
jgi:hypothetical protein